jgi:hypothetical protein
MSKVIKSKVIISKVIISEVIISQVIIIKFKYYYSAAHVNFSTLQQ